MVVLAGRSVVVVRGQVPPATICHLLPANQEKPSIDSRARAKNTKSPLANESYEAFNIYGYGILHFKQMKKFLATSCLVFYKKVDLDLTWGGREEARSILEVMSRLRTVFMWQMMSYQDSR